MAAFKAQQPSEEGGMTPPSPRLPSRATRLIPTRPRRTLTRARPARCLATWSSSGRPAARTGSGNDKRSNKARTYGDPLRVTADAPVGTI